MSTLIPNVTPIAIDSLFNIAQIKSNISLLQECTSDSVTVVLYGSIDTDGTSFTYHAKALVLMPKEAAQMFAVNRGRLACPTKDGTWVEQAESGQQPTAEAALRSLLYDSIYLMNQHYETHYYPAGIDTTMVV
ncbi:hypothetical protein Vi05172_g3104 [Venturia inaequalis]|uniref:Uncharacterized protein n=1 Tax=Venturia inaequalis TaxID=5025 RepID=A0A8H3V4Q6_VENIN|nr:hypothetical protein EG327_006368 [Venturia inaequalis]RDI87015.1 hypothetical protein Vi05172_g3104 [Venturia inaequalis]